MAIRDYEAVYIVDPTLDNEQLQPIIEKYRQVVADNGGEVVSAAVWEKRRLAYEVKGRTEGIYIVMKFKGEPTTASELERLMKLAEDVMRHLIVRDEEPKGAAPQTELRPRETTAAVAQPVESQPEEVQEEAPVEPAEALPEEVAEQAPEEPVEAQSEEVAEQAPEEPVEAQSEEAKADSTAE